MIRVLYVARYTRPSMDRKLELMAESGEAEILLIRPQCEQDVRQLDRSLPFQARPVPVIGDPNDSHRALYRTVAFSLPRFKPHIIHAEEEPDSLAALQIIAARSLFAQESVLVLHTWQNVNRPKTEPVRWILRQTLHRADAVLCANAEALSVLDQLGYRGKKALIPPQGVDTRVFHPCRHENDGVFTVVYAGRLVQEKGLDLLIDAVSMIGRECRLRIAGEGPERASLEWRARTGGGGNRVEFLGAVDERSLADLLCHADVLVLPSRGTPVWKEQFGRVLIEAMASGLPVVGSSSGAIPEVIGDDGLIFRENDVASLVECLDRLAKSPNLGEELGRKGLDRVKRLYSHEAIAAQTLDFLRCIQNLKRT